MKNLVLAAKAIVLAGCIALLATSASAQAPLFQVVTINVTVADFAKWKPVYEADLPIRQAAGLTQIDLLQDVENPNRVLLAFQIADLQKAKDFIADPRLKEIMQKSGVVSAPDIAFHNVISVGDSKIEPKDDIQITHRVKDFDAWFKVFDAEGAAARANEGLIDLVLARGIDDPNVVTLVFGVTDWTKAKAALASEAKKKLMMSAGVEGMPKFLFLTRPQ